MFAFLRPLSPFKSPSRKDRPVGDPIKKSATIESSSFLCRFPSSKRKSKIPVPGRPISLQPLTPVVTRIETPEYLSTYDDFFEEYPTRLSETQHIDSIRSQAAHTSGHWLKIRRLNLTKAEETRFRQLREESSGPIRKSLVLRTCGLRKVDSAHRMLLTSEIRMGGEYWDEDPFTGEIWIVQWEQQPQITHTPTMRRTGLRKGLRSEISTIRAVS